MHDSSPVSVAEDRFDRLRRIEWWDAARLARSKVLVIGMGALGNEILKHLALMGVAHVFIVDLDTVEPSNLSRSVLFRDTDVGRSKVEAAAEVARELYPDMNVGWYHGDAVYGLGLGVYRWADAVIGGLDSREARLYINRASYRVGVPFVDGATEILRGIVRVFVPPEGPCYECTMAAADWEVLRERRGCAGMRARGVPVPPIPTTSVTASVIAALQCQETLKLLQGLPGLSGEGVVFDGMANEMYRVGFSRNDACHSHDPLEEIVELEASVETMTPRELLVRARQRLSGDPQLELRHEMLATLECLGCGTQETLMQPLESVNEARAACPGCGTLRRAATFRTIDDTSPYLDVCLAALGCPPFEIMVARGDDAACGFELTADAATVLRGAAGTTARLRPK
jgi:molybdopterin/thiamine biosynthesis adenylyltransferase